jgi:hypothetical protein
VECLYLFDAEAFGKTRGLSCPGFESRQEQDIFLPLRKVQTGSGAHPASWSCLLRHVLLIFFVAETHTAFE